MIELLIFDLDGCLFHSAPGITTAFNKVMKDHGEPEVDEKTVIDFIGNGVHDLLIKLNSRLLHQISDISQLEQEFHKYYRQTYLRESYLYPNLIEFFQRWQGRIALCTNKPEFYARNLISQSELNQFNWEAMVFGDTLSVKKPHPDVIHKILNELGVRAEAAAIVGDGPADVGAAMNSGIYSIAVSFGYTEISELIQLGAHATISNYYELAKVVRDLR